VEEEEEEWREKEEEGVRQILGISICLMILIRRRCDLFQIGNEFPAATGALERSHLATVIDYPFLFFPSLLPPPPSISFHLPPPPSQSAQFRKR